MDILKLLQYGSAKLIADSDKADKEKAGTLRGGSGGWISEDLQYVTGRCPRLAWARYAGFTTEDNADKEPMFSAGHLSEDGVCNVLSAANIQYLRESSVPTSWTTANGTLVTGRPDIVLTDGGEKLSHGLELKLVSSLWTALEILQTPKTDHVIQATHYSKQLNIPYSIVYVNRTNWSLLSDFALKKAPKEGEAGSELLNYKEYKKKLDNGKTIKYRAPKDMKPFYRVFPLNFDEHGQVQIDTGKEIITSFITWEGIERYYNFVSMINTTGNCGPVPTAVDLAGNSKSYKACEYCNLDKICNRTPNMSLDLFTKICETVQAEILSNRDELFNKE
jgi:hypothetical protein